MARAVVDADYSSNYYMNIKNPKILTLVVLVLATIPGLVSAQAVGTNSVSVSSTPSNTPYTSGTTNMTFGTFTLTALQSGSYQVASLPVTVSMSGSGTTNYLSGCILKNSGGSTLTTNGNVLNTVNTGINTFTFDTPLVVTNGTPVTLTVNCNTSTGTPTGSTFSFIANAPVLTGALTVAMTSLPSITPSETNAPIAAITLNAGGSGSNLNINSLPITATYSNGLTASNLSNCHISYQGSVLDSNSNGVINSGTNTITFNTPLVAVGGGSAIPLFFSCNVASSAPIGGTVMLSLVPANIVATNASNGASVTALQGYNPSTGTSGSLGGTSTIVSTTGTVTAPNTGAGADAPVTTIALLASAFLVMLGIGYIVRERRTNKA